MATKKIAVGESTGSEPDTISVTDAVQSLLACADLAALKTLLGIAALEAKVVSLDSRLDALEAP